MYAGGYSTNHGTFLGPVSDTRHFSRYVWICPSPSTKFDTRAYLKITSNLALPCAKVFGVLEVKGLASLGSVGFLYKTVIRRSPHIKGPRLHLNAQSKLRPRACRKSSIHLGTYLQLLRSDRAPTLFFASLVSPSLWSVQSILWRSRVASPFRLW
jgi:hypothetical protein